MVNFENLPPRNDLRNHSLDGFSCGYNGSGPSQLALAILAYEYSDVDALKYYQQFRSVVIAGLSPDEKWILRSVDIEKVMRRLKMTKYNRLSELRQQVEILQRIVVRLPIGQEMYLAVHGAMDEARQEQDRIFYRKENG